MKAVKAVIFDLDGTLIDTIEDLKDSLNHVLESRGYMTRTYDEVKRFVGYGLGKLVERGLPAGTEPETVTACTAEMISYYSKHSLVKTAPYEGIRELVSALKDKGLRLAVVTNKNEAEAIRICTHFFGDAFDTIVGDREGLPLKPDSAPVFKTLEELSVTADEAIYIGDSEVDVKTALNSDLRMIAVLWGFREKSVLIKEGATAFAEIPSDILRVEAKKINSTV